MAYLSSGTLGWRKMAFEVHVENLYCWLLNEAWRVNWAALKNRYPSLKEMFKSLDKLAILSTYLINNL
jgi:hypothetical protein